MKLMKRLLSLIVIAPLFVFTACEDDEGADTMNTKDAQTSLKTMDQQMATSIDNMQNSEGMTAVLTLQKIMETTSSGLSSSVESGVLTSLNAIPLKSGDVSALKSTTGESFNFSEKTGTYKYKSERGILDNVSNEPNDKIVVEYPADSSNMGTNNATLEITDYKANDENYPTSVKASITHDNGTELVSYELKNAKWNDIGEPVLLESDATIKPYNHYVLMDSTAGNFEYNVSQGGDKILTSSANVTFMSITEDSSALQKFDGSFTFGNTTINGNVNVENIRQNIQNTFRSAQEDGSSPSEKEMEKAVNKEINAVVKVDGAKAADIKVDYSPESSKEPYRLMLKFNDGTEEKAAEYFSNAIAKIKTIFNNMGIKLEENTTPMK